MNQIIDTIIDFKTLNINKRKSITGNIYFKIGEHFFPEEGWNDFVVVILSWWINTIINIKKSSVNTKHSFSFMDGPLLILADKVNEEELELVGIKENTISKEVLFESTCTIGQLEGPVINISKRLLNEIRLKGWISDDIENLRRSLNIIKKDK